MSHELRSGDRVVVTGAAGFIGSAVVRALLSRDVDVVALLEPGAPTSNLDALDVERQEVDITKARQLDGVFEGARFCFHLAAKFGFWPKDAATFYDVNVNGSRNVVRAATFAGVERTVFTSTVATLGLWETKEGRPSTEDDVADLSHLYGNYKQTKYVAEHEVLRLAAQGAPVVLVLPTMPHGPFDHRPTPSGKVVLDYLNGRMPGYVDTAMNVAHVDDLAHGHLLRSGERSAGSELYLWRREHHDGATARDTLAGDGTTRLGAPVSFGLSPDRGIPVELHRGRPARTRTASPARGGADGLYHHDVRRLEGPPRIGYTSRPAAQALYESARWFVEHGYVDADRVAQIAWHPPAD